MKTTIIHIALVGIGILILVFHKSYARFIAEQQDSFWGFHFGVNSVKVTETISLIVGLGFVVFGLLSLFHILEMK